MVEVFDLDIIVAQIDLFAAVVNLGFSRFLIISDWIVTTTYCQNAANLIQFHSQGCGGEFKFESFLLRHSKYYQQQWSW